MKPTIMSFHRAVATRDSADKMGLPIDLRLDLVESYTQSDTSVTVTMASGDEHCLFIAFEAFQKVMREAMGGESPCQEGVPRIHFGPWTVLRDLPDGALFETRDGSRCVVSKYSYDNGKQRQCILLESGEYAHFPGLNKEEVREIVLEG